jgi:maltose O-acetyltransferase
MKTEKDKMLSGELYQGGDAELVKDRLNARRLTRLFNQSVETEDSLRREVVKELFGSVGENVHIEPTFRCPGGAYLYGYPSVGC